LSDGPFSALDERVWSAVKRLGLSEYEVKAYVSLLHLRGGTANEISIEAGIPVSKIYETLRSLERKGLIRIERGRPMRYYPESPQAASEALRKSFESSIKSDLDVFVSTLTPLYQGVGPERPDLWIIRGEPTLWRSVKEVMSRADKQLSLALPFIPSEIQQFLLSTSALITERGGVVRVLLSPSAAGKMAKSLSTVAKVRVREISFSGGIINDASEAILVLLSSGENRPQLAIYSSHVSLTAIAQLYFDMLWEHSASLKDL